MVDESLVNECREARQMLWIADITSESRPFGVAELHGTGGERRLLRARRALRHPFVERELHADLLQAASSFSRTSTPACARSTSAIRITRAKSAYFIPAITDKTDQRCVKVDGAERCKVAIQTNNVEVDDRGYIYIVDRANTGLHILELTGEARRTAAFPR